jgi:hypothetical protein
MADDNRLLDLILNKLDDIEKEQRLQGDTLLKTADSLNYNTERTNAVEAMVKPLHEDSIKRKASAEYKKKLTLNISYIIGIISALSGLIFGIIELLK